MNVNAFIGETAALAVIFRESGGSSAPRAFRFYHWRLGLLGRPIPTTPTAFVRRRTSAVKRLRRAFPVLGRRSLAKAASRAMTAGVQFPKLKAVIARSPCDEAIHRSARKQARVDCFVASAPRNDGERARNDKTQVRILAARSARGLPSISAPLKCKGARECRVHGAPAVSCANTTQKAHTSIQVHRDHPASPHAVALRLITCSPRRTGWMTPSPAKLPPPTWHMRRHAGTTRFCRPQEAPSSVALLAATAARPAFLTFAKRPFAWDGMGRI
jgi:hypothetical protein